MHMKNVLLISGGWDGHKPGEIVQLFSDAPGRRGLETEIFETLETLADFERL